VLFDADDAEFKAALRHHRVMTVVEERASAPTGMIGYESALRGQLLLFPKSLQPFAGARVVGIKFDLLAGPPAGKGKRSPKAAAKPKKKRPASVPKKQEVAVDAKQPAPKKPSPEGERKVIEFPSQGEEEGDPRVEELKRIARGALVALRQRRLREVERALTDLLRT
jgi:hypothetical protein